MSDFIKGREAEKEIGKSLEGAPGQKAKRPTRQPLAIEVCCGHAGLSAALRIKGWDVRPNRLGGQRTRDQDPGVAQRPHGLGSREPSPADGEKG